MKQITGKNSLVILFLVTFLLGGMPMSHAHGTANPLKYQTDYFLQHKLYRKGNLLTVLTLNLEWPLYLSGSGVPVLQSHLCSEIFGNTATSAAEGLAAYVKTLGEEIHDIPEEAGLQRQYIHLLVQQLGGEEGKYLSFCTLVLKRSGNVSKPEVRRQTMFTYDIVNERILTSKDILKLSVMPGNESQYNLIERIVAYNSQLINSRTGDQSGLTTSVLVEDVLYGDVMTRVDGLPDQVCLLPLGVVFNLKGNSDKEGFDELTLLPMNEMLQFLKRSVRKWLANGEKKTVDTTLVSRPIAVPDAMVDTTAVYDVVEEMPKFKGGPKAIGEFFGRVVKYPDYEQMLNIQGRVVVAFVVERDGSVSTPSVISPVSPGVDREAVMAVMDMPKWKPGRHHGIAVRTRMNVPVNFKMNTPKTEKQNSDKE